jgi:hypothetical protein
MDIAIPYVILVFACQVFLWTRKGTRKNGAD